MTTDNYSLKRNKRKLTAIGKAIKVQAAKKEIPLKDLARAAGTSSKYLNNIMYGERPKSKYIPIVLGILDINPDKYIA